MPHQFFFAQQGFVQPGGQAGLVAQQGFVQPAVPLVAQQEEDLVAQQLLSVRAAKAVETRAMRRFMVVCEVRCGWGAGV